MVFVDTDHLGLITRVGDDQVIPPVVKPQMKAAVILGEGAKGGILTKDVGAGQRLSTSIQDHAVDGEGLILGKNVCGDSEKKEEKRQEYQFHGYCFDPE